MARVFQAGLGSGGIAVLDLLVRDPEISHFTLVDPDSYAAHNVCRHLFGLEDVARSKTELAAEWAIRCRPDVAVRTFECAIESPAAAEEIEAAIRACDIGVCAVDSEVGKFHFDALFRRMSKPWVLGEVLSGGIAGWIHRFEADGPCFGCVSRLLQRDPSPTAAVDYSQPIGSIPEATVPASKAAIAAIASIHALVALDRLRGCSPEFTSLLMSLGRVEGIFERSFEATRFSLARQPDCLICRTLPPTPTSRLERDLADALDRLGGEPS